MLTRTITAAWKRPNCEAMLLTAQVRPGRNVTLEMGRENAEGLGYKKAGRYKLILTRAPGAYVGVLSGNKFFLKFRDNMIAVKEGQTHIRCCFLPKGWRAGTLIKRELKPL